MPRNFTPLSAAQKRAVTRAAKSKTHLAESRKFVEEMLVNNADWPDNYDFDEGEFVGDIWNVLMLMHNMSPAERKASSDIIVAAIYKSFLNCYEPHNDWDYDGDAYLTESDDGDYYELTEDEQEEFSRGREGW